MCHDSARRPKTDREAGMTWSNRCFGRIVPVLLVLLVIHACEALQKQHLRSNSEDQHVPEHKRRALRKTCNASISEYMQFTGRLIAEEKRCEICTHVYDCGFCEDTHTCLPGEHQGPMRFEAKNCSKWHFSPVSCMSGESKGWVEPELKAVEDDKDQGAKERLLDKLMKQKEIGKKTGTTPDPCSNHRDLQSKLSDKADKIDIIELNVRNKTLNPKHGIHKLRSILKWVQTYRKGNVEFSRCFMVYDLERRLNHLLLEMAKLLNKQKAKPKAKDNTIVYPKSKTLASQAAPKSKADYVANTEQVEETGEDSDDNEEVGETDENREDSDTNAEEDSNDDVREESNQTTEEDSDENAEEEANDDGEEESNQNAEEDSDGNDEEESNQNAEEDSDENDEEESNDDSESNEDTEPQTPGNKIGKPKCNVTVQRKTINGEKCVFPFRLGLGTPEEKWYCDCTTKGEDRPWCSIQDREPFEFDYCAGFPGYDDNPTSSDSAGSGPANNDVESSPTAGDAGSGESGAKSGPTGRDKQTSKITNNASSSNGDAKSGPTGGDAISAPTGVTGISAGESGKSGAESGPTGSGPTGATGAASSASGAMPSKTGGKEETSQDTERDKESAKEAEKETREEEEKEESEKKREEEKEEAKEQQEENDATKKEIEVAGKEEQDEAESIAKESRTESEKENAEKKKSESVEKNALETNKDKDSLKTMQNDMKSIEKDAEKEVDNEFHAADEQYIHPPNTTKLENEIKQLDKEFGEHVQHAIGVIVNRRSNESKIVGSQSKHSKDNLVQGSAGANLDHDAEAHPIIGNRMDDVPRAVEALRLQAATTFLGSNNGAGIGMTATSEERLHNKTGTPFPLLGRGNFES
eukprot:g5164.t1